MTERLRLEITIEPFVAGNPGRHVTVAGEVARAAGLDVEFAPFGTVVTGSTDDVVALMSDLVARPVKAGATRLTLQIEAI
jgi:uncharacterized protein YqgV (UPF0045/DUF77 family)